MDVYIAGCPPRPEALLDALIKLQAKVGNEPVLRELEISKRLASREVPEGTPVASEKAGVAVPVGHSSFVIPHS